MEIVPEDISLRDVREEVNSRTHRAGYTNREGGPRTTGRIIMKPATEQYRKNYRRIFNHD